MGLNVLKHLRSFLVSNKKTINNLASTCSNHVVCHLMLKCNGLQCTGTTLWTLQFNSAYSCIFVGRFVVFMIIVASQPHLQPKCFVLSLFCFLQSQVGTIHYYNWIITRFCFASSCALLSAFHNIGKVVIFGYATGAVLFIKQLKRLLIVCIY